MLGEPDPIVALGAIVARELYGTRMPVVRLETEAYDRLIDGVGLQLSATADRVLLEPTG